MSTTVKINGYMLRDAIKQAELRASSAQSRFADTLFKFEGEDKPTPMAVAKQIEDAELALVQLRTAQSRYNFAVKVQIGGIDIPLAEAIKRMVAIGKVEKLWRDTVITSVSPYHRQIAAQMTRNADQLVAVATTTPEDRSGMVKRYTKLIGELRKAIAVGNAREVEVEGLDPTLFE